MTRKPRRTKKHPKPTGTIGPIELDPQARAAQFTPIKFPTTKPEIEQYILDLAIQSVEKTGHRLYSLVAPPLQNAEADFDFTLSTTSGVEYLDLVEFAPLHTAHEAAPRSYYVWDFAQQLFAQVTKKVDKYGASNPHTIHLLAYTTDWRLRPDDRVLSLLTLWFSRHPHCFKTIYYYSPDDQTSGQLLRLYPSRPDEIKRVDEESLRYAQVLLADFSRLEIDSSGAVTVPISPPPSRDKPGSPPGAA